MRKDTLLWLVPALVAIALAAALWFYWSRSESLGPEAIEERAPAESPAEAPGETAPEAPEHPLEETADEPEERQELRPLPPLEESDEYFRLELSERFGEAVSERLVEDNLVERLVATVDNLSRDQIAERIKPLSPTPGQFLVTEGDAEDEYILDPRNYERYDPVVNVVAGTDIEEAEEVYRRFYPLFQRAYADLGYPDDYFNDRVIEVINHLLETPEVEGPVRLVRPHVLYEYADPELEDLSPGQKLLLRIGPENAATVKQKLREFRDEISLDRATATP